MSEGKEKRFVGEVTESPQAIADARLENTKGVASFERMKITEEANGELIKEWYDEARGQTLESLPAFMGKLLNDYEHDYGTICHAVTACAIGAAWAANHSEQGGITGFQATAIMWEFIKHWMSIKGPARLLEYRDMLYPQHREDFRTISPKTWADLQSEARAALARADGGEFGKMPPDVKAHMERIVAGKVPFGYRVRHS